MHYEFKILNNLHQVLAKEIQLSISFSSFFLLSRISESCLVEYPLYQMIVQCLYHISFVCLLQHHIMKVAHTKLLLFSFESIN